MEGNPIQFEELINFKGGFDDIRKTISLLEMLINQGLELSKNFETAGKKISESFDGIKESAKEVQKTLSSEKSYNELVKLLNVIEALDKQSDLLQKSYAELNKQTIENNKNTDTYINAHKELSKQYEKSTKQSKEKTAQNKAETGSLKALQQEYKKQENILKEIAETVNGEINPAFAKQENVVREAKLAYDKLNKTFIENYKIAKDAAKNNSLNINSLEALRLKLSEMKKASLKIDVDTEDFKRASEEINVLNDKIKAIEFSQGQFGRNVGNYPQPEPQKQGFLGGLKGGLTDAFSFGGAAGAGIAVGTKAVEFAIEKIQELAGEINETRKQLAEVENQFGKSDATDKAVAKIKGVAKVYDLEFKEIFQASKAITSSFGTTLADSTQSINRALALGADKDEVLNFYKEYSTQLSEAGFSLQDFEIIAAQSSKLGLFDDKAFDNIKELKLQFSDLSKDQTSLIKTLGKTGDAILENFAKGDKRAGIIGLNKAISDLEKSGGDAGKFITGFGGPLEDLGRAGRELIGNLDSLDKGLTKAQQQQLDYVASEERVAAATVELVSKFGGVGKSLEIAYANTKAYILETLNGIIDYFQGVYNKIDSIFVELGFSSGSFIDGLTSAFDFLKTIIENLVKNSFAISEGFINGIQKIVAAFRGLQAGVEEFGKQFSFIGDGIDYVFKEINSAISYAEHLFDELFTSISETGSGATNFLSESFDYLFSGIIAYFQPIADGFSKLFDYIANIGTQIYEGLGLDVLEAKFGSIFGATEKGYDAALDRMNKSEKKSKDLQKANAEEAKTIEQTTEQQKINAKQVAENQKKQSDQAKQAQADAKKLLDATKKFNEELVNLDLSKEQERINLLKEQGKLQESINAQAILDSRKLAIEKQKSIESLKDKTKVDLGDNREVSIAKKADLEKGLADIEETFASKSAIIQDKLTNDLAVIANQYAMTVTDLQKQFFENQLSDLEKQLTSEEDLIQESLDTRLNQLKLYDNAKKQLLDIQFEADTKAINDKYKATDDASNKARENELQKLQIAYEKQITLLKTESIDKEQAIRETFNKVELERKVKSLDLQVTKIKTAANQGIITEKDAAEQINKIETEKTKSIIDNIKGKLTNTKLTADQRLNLETELASQELQLSEKTKEKREKDLQKFKETTDNVFELVKKQVLSKYDGEQKLIDKQIDNRKTLLDSEIRLAEISGQQVDIAGAQGDLLEAENRKIEIQKNKQNAELGLAFAEALKNYLQAGDSGANAFLKASKDITLAKLFAGSFYEGGFANAEGYTNGSITTPTLFIGHGGEYIGNHKQVNKYPELFENLERERLFGGDLIIPKKYQEVKDSANVIVVERENRYEKQMAGLIDNLNNTLKGIKPTTIEVDSFLRIKEKVESIEKGNKTVTTNVFM